MSGGDPELLTLCPCLAFKNISKYFSKQEWARLGYSEKITFVYMKRNYETMTRLVYLALKTSIMKKKKNFYNTPTLTTGPLSSLEKWILIVCDFHVKKVESKKPVKEKKHSELEPGTSGPEQAQRQLCPRDNESTSSQQSKKTSGKRNNFSYLFGNNSSVFPGHVQVNGLVMGDGSWTGLGPGWAESLLSSS
ncbi:hypothetical protein FD755_015893 [Muntiacus reevesi]|uniref:KRAB-related domain-containing protein n=1 Tax=Muntiacus reevesi TaxID=9886 RepID=A0A5N3XDQ9_MUNRE|nr:hypothetical protein FD755_015893 [Muntiacus reevesi]